MKMTNDHKKLYSTFEMTNCVGKFSPIKEVTTRRTHSGTQGGTDEEWRKYGNARRRFKC